MAQEEDVNEVAHQVVSGRWLNVGAATIDTEAVTGVQGRLVLESGRSHAVTDVHLFGTVMTVDVPPAPLREAIDRLRNAPDPEPAYDPEVLEALASMWIDSTESRRLVRRAAPALSHRLDQLAGISADDH